MASTLDTANKALGFVVKQHELLCNILRCVAMCCSMLQCVTVCCSALQRVAECTSFSAKRLGLLQCVAAWCTILLLQCGAVWCSVVQCGAVWCSVVQCVAVCCSVLQCVAVCCSVLQCVAVRWSVLRANFSRISPAISKRNSIKRKPVRMAVRVQSTRRVLQQLCNTMGRCMIATS